MPVDYNVFRILGDVSHTLSKCILMWAIHSNKSAEGEPCLSLPLAPDRLHDPDGSAIDRILTTLGRYLSHNADLLHASLLSPVPGPFLDSTLLFVLELCPQDLLHRLVSLYRLSHDASVCADARTRKGMEAGSVQSGRVAAGRTNRVLDL